MGLFDWLTGKRSNVEVAADRIWLTDKAKLAGIATEVEQALAQAAPPVALFLVAHFQDYLQELQALAEEKGFDAGRVLVALAGDLENRSPPSGIFDHSGSLSFVVGQRHPLLSHDDALLQFARSLPCRCRITHHLSLEEPMMAALAGDWIVEALKRLGMSEDEAIENRAVTRTIRAAQKKVEKMSVGDTPADSVEQWFSLNSRELWREYYCKGPTE